VCEEGINCIRKYIYFGTAKVYVFLIVAKYM